MLHTTNRRAFLKTGTATGALVGMGDLGFLARLSPVSAAEARLDARGVLLRPEIVPVVRMIDETPRDQLLEVVASRIRDGLSYRELLAGLLLAGVTNVEPRPSVGHKFHAVLVVNSAHLASLSSPAEHRWLPLFWALDYYKSAAARDVEERGDWTMGAVDDSNLPSPVNAPQAFVEAMDAWDEGAADRAIAAFARSAGSAAVYESLFQYGARDFRSIGHKAIYVANSLRTLQCIGWRHAEPVLRSLAYALLMHEGENPSRRDAEADRPYRRNLELVERIRADWQVGTVDRAATHELVVGLRTCSHEQACDQVVELINRGTAPRAIWDGLFTAASELLMRQPAIVALHAVTTTNALHFAYETSAQDATRRLMMLQNAAFLPLFRAAMEDRNDIKNVTLDDLQPLATEAGGVGALDEIFAEMSGDPVVAAGKALGYLEGSQNAKSLIDAARVQVFLKGDDAHDYKFSSAVLEDYYHISPTWRNRYLASNTFMLHGSQGPDNNLVARTRAALQG